MSATSDDAPTAPEDTERRIRELSERSTQGWSRTPIADVQAQIADALRTFGAEQRAAGAAEERARQALVRLVCNCGNYRRGELTAGWVCPIHGQQF